MVSKCLAPLSLPTSAFPLFFSRVLPFKSNHGQRASPPRPRSSHVFVLQHQEIRMEASAARGEVSLEEDHKEEDYQSGHNS